MKTQEIRSWYGSLLYTAHVEDNDEFPIRTAMERAVLAGVSLAGANLAGARLDDASLTGARLDDANLACARLDDASLAGANLACARLDDASLAGANLACARLDDASLAGANLAGASLDDANLDGANLVRASLDGVNLARASLERIRDDFRAVLDISPGEVVGLLAKLRAGEVDGKHYQGECACLVGTIASIRGVNYEQIPGLTPNSARRSERWFLGIRIGSTPDNNQLAAITDDWICEWQAERGEGDWHVACRMETR